MKALILISLLTTSMPLFCSFGADILEFKLAQGNEHSGWNKSEFEGNQIWISPIVELDSKHIASAELAPNNFKEYFSSLSTEEQTELRRKAPDIDAHLKRVPPIFITLTEDGAKLLEEITTKHIGKKLAILFEGKVLMAPIIREPISGNTMSIVSTLTEAEAIKIISKLNNKK